MHSENFSAPNLLNLRRSSKTTSWPVAALGVRAPTARRTTLRSSVTVEQSDMDAEEPLRQSLPLSTKRYDDRPYVLWCESYIPSKSVRDTKSLGSRVHGCPTSAGLPTIFIHSGTTSQFREYSNWPKTEWLMYDIVQKRWIDIPTNCYIDAGTGPMITHVKDMEADLSTFEDLEDVIEHAFNTYMVSIERPARPTQSPVHRATSRIFPDFGWLFLARGIIIAAS